MSKIDTTIPNTLELIISSLLNSDNRSLDEIVKEKVDVYREDPEDLGRIGGLAPWLFIDCLETIRAERVIGDLIRNLEDVSGYFTILTSNFPKLEQYRLFRDESLRLADSCRLFLAEKVREEKGLKDKESDSGQVQTATLPDKSSLNQYSRSKTTFSSHNLKKTDLTDMPSQNPSISSMSHPDPTPSHRAMFYVIGTLLVIALLSGYFMGRRRDAPIETIASDTSMTLNNAPDLIASTPTQSITLSAHAQQPATSVPTSTPKINFQTVSQDQTVNGSLIVEVFDEMGQPIFATIQLDMRFETGTRVQFNRLLSTANHTLTVSADGFMSRTQNIAIDPGVTNIQKITLYRN